jgi:hypothetical protein
MRLCGINEQTKKVEKGLTFDFHRVTSIWLTNTLRMGDFKT